MVLLVFVILASSNFLIKTSIILSQFYFWKNQPDSFDPSTISIIDFQISTVVMTKLADNNDVSIGENGCVRLFFDDCF